MQPTGILAFNHCKEEKSKIYSFENDAKKLEENFENHFKTNKKAWEFFITQAPSYKKTIFHWIMTA